MSSPKLCQLDRHGRLRRPQAFHIRYPIRLAASLTGYGIIGFVVWWQWVVNFGGLPPDLAIWDRVGDQVWAGISPYSVDLSWTGLFFYAPPWALPFALTSWMPIWVQAAVVMGLELAALRYIAGSWLRVGYIGLFPMTGAELGNGSFNLVMAASVAMAIRGDGRLATFAAFAKLSPILAVRDLRRAGLIVAISLVVTLPVVGWWMDWARLLLYSQAHYSIGYPISWPLRLLVAVGLLLVMRDRACARVLATFLAIPALYSYSVVLLYPLLGRLDARNVDDVLPKVGGVLTRPLVTDHDVPVGR